MRRPVTALLPLAMAIVLGAGCGEGSSLAGGQTGAGVSQRGSFADLLIQKDDLPPAAKPVKETTTTSCDPLKVMSTPGSEAAKSTIFAIGEVRIQEAVAVFANEAAARAAFDALNAESRLDCVRATIEFQKQSVTTVAPRDLGLGDEVRSVRLRALSEETGKPSSIDILSFRFGRTVSSMLFVSPTPTMPPALFADTVEAAAGLLAKRSGDPRAPG